jgi:hypothetical protein
MWVKEGDTERERERERERGKHFIWPPLTSQDEELALIALPLRVSYPHLLLFYPYNILQPPFPSL